MPDTNFDNCIKIEIPDEEVSIWLHLLIGLVTAMDAENTQLRKQLEKLTSKTAKQ